MRSTVKFVVVLTAVVGSVIMLSVPGQASVTGGDGGGKVTVGASGSGSGGGSQGGGAGGGGGGSGASPWQCIYTKLVLNDEGGIAPGGPTPGSWYSVTCTDQATGAVRTETEWIPDATAPTNPPVSPFAVALEAENSLRLPPPTGYTNPAGISVVNLPTWLWIDASIWHSFSVTATVGTVSATATATPTMVTWSTGDGVTTTCHGPGTAYDPSQPSSQQSTYCSHTYTVSSAGQPPPADDPNTGAFTVRAAIDWSVSWSALGETGGGTLPSLSTSSSTTLRVEQVESVNTNGSSA